MKLRNKKTGEIGELTNDNRAKPYRKNFAVFVKVDDLEVGDGTYFYDTLSELYENWEDYKEPKDFYYINENGGICKYVPSDPDGEDLTYMGYQKEIGNYFKTKEEAEKAVEKLKAWKRLKDYNVKFNLDFVKNNIAFTYRINGTLYSSAEESRIIFEDLERIFGGRE